jgi:hypothetical protein
MAASPYLVDRSQRGFASVSIDEANFCFRGEERTSQFNAGRSIAARWEAEFANSLGYWSTESQRVFPHL